MPDDYSHWQNCLQVSAVSDLGLRRSNNQDSMSVALARDMDDWSEAGHLFVVADGMGAHAAGELASKLAVDQVTHLYRKHLDISPTAAIADAIYEANEEIHRRGQANLAFHNMGTTCSALILLPQGALIAHVGDSRVYRLRGEELQQLTFDHSLVWEMRHVNKDNDVESAGIPKNVITRSLGPHERVKVDLEGPFPIEVGDTFLLCSDGLTGCLNDNEIAATLRHLDPEVATQLMVNLATLRGAPDNVTIIVVRVTGKEMTTRAAKAAPLTINETSEEPQPASIWAWIALGTLLLIAAALWAAGQNFWALVALAAAAFPGTVVLVKESGVLRDSGIRLTPGKRLGKAPYQTAEAEDAKTFVEQLSAAMEQAQEMAKQFQWKIPQDEVLAAFTSSADHAKAGEFQAAARDLLSTSDLLADGSRQFAKEQSSKA